ncbi:MAG TPA: hypothetical protein VNC50_21940 [Planctomycetia bacterium]|nr:hypothetical protein [Planctomycetia bacterium]
MEPSSPFALTPPFLRRFGAATFFLFTGSATLFAIGILLSAVQERDAAVFFLRASGLGWPGALALTGWLAKHACETLAAWIAFRVEAKPAPAEAPLPLTEVITPQPREIVAAPVAAPAPKTKPKAPEPAWDWRSDFKAARAKRDAAALLDLRDRIVKNWKAERREKFDRKLGKWMTRHFQQELLRGRAPELLPALTQAATVFAYIEEFAYFQAVLPHVKMAADLKAAAKQDVDRNGVE